MSPRMLALVAERHGWMPAIPQAARVGCFARVCAMRPGTAVFAGDPVLVAAADGTNDPEDAAVGQPAFVTGFEAMARSVAAALTEAGLPCRVQTLPQWVQVYRLLDGRGKMASDVVVPVGADPMAGMVLLHPVSATGQWLADSDDDAAHARWRERQQSALPHDAGTYKVRWVAQKTAICDKG